MSRTLKSNCIQDATGMGDAVGSPMDELCAGQVWENSCDINIAFLPDFVEEALPAHTKVVVTKIRPHVGVLIDMECRDVHVLIRGREAVIVDFLFDSEIFRRVEWLRRVA